jgi:1-acyl-sn-glycerol-3-phosphate acyltransferase
MIADAAVEGKARGHELVTLASRRKPSAGPIRPGSLALARVQAFRRPRTPTSSPTSSSTASPTWGASPASTRVRREADDPRTARHTRAVVAPAAAGPVHRPFRFSLVRTVLAVIVRFLFRLRVEGRENLAQGPALYCFNHLNWADPLILLTVLPPQPKLAMFGPKEADMTMGGRNRLIMWAGFGIPYRPEKNDLIGTTRRVQRILDDGWVIVIAGEGRIHRGERELLPLADGTAYFALRAGVPIIPVAVNGTSWLGFRRTIRIRVGEGIPAEGRPTREHVSAMTARTAAALHALVADFPDRSEPGPFGRWLTELFNDWPEGSRPALGGGDAAGTAQRDAG